MGINRAEQRLDDRLINEVRRMRSDFRELKSFTQPIGGDGLLVEGVPSGGAASGSATVTAGGLLSFTVTVTPLNQTLTVWNFAYTLLVDTNSAGYEYRYGSSLSAAQRKLRVQSRIDWASSSDATNVRVYIVEIENYDTSDHDIYLYIRAYIPKLTGTAI